MYLNDEQITEALNSYSGEVCVDKEMIDEVAFGPNEFFQATDRKYRIVGIIVPANNEKGWKIVDAVLFEEESV